MWQKLQNLIEEQRDGQILVKQMSNSLYRNQVIVKVIYPPFIVTKSIKELLYLSSNILIFIMLEGLSTMLMERQVLLLHLLLSLHLFY